MDPGSGRVPKWSQLRAFDSVAATGTMTGAAARLHLTQTAITRSIRALERDLQTRLMERTHRGSFLTPEGQILRRRTHRAFAQIEAALGGSIGLDPASDPVARLSRKLSGPHLRSLLAIARAGNFRRAAAVLGVSEPSLNRPALAIEKLLGISLYRRMPDGTGLTAGGADLARRIALAMNEIETGVEELAARPGMARMAVGVLPLTPQGLLTRAVEELLNKNPRARVSVQQANYDTLIAAMRSGQIDLIFGALRAPPPFDDIREEAIFDDPYCIVCRTGHPLTRLARVTRADLRRFDWIFPTQPLPRRAVVDDLIAKWRLSARMQFETNSLAAIVSALAASDRISLLPREFVRVEIGAGTLAILDIRVPHPRRRIGIASRSNWLPTALQSEFLSLLRSLRSAAMPQAGKYINDGDTRHMATSSRDKHNSVM